MGFFSDRICLRASLPAIILWGCFGGICLAAAAYYMQRAELIVYISCYSDIVSQIFPIWKFGTIVLLSLTLGMISADLFCSDRTAGTNPVLTGLISGICSAFVAIIIVEIYPLGFFGISHPISLAGTFLSALVVYILIITLPQVFGAWFHEFRMRPGHGPADTEPPALAGRKSSHLFFLVALCTVILMFPLGILALPVDTTDYSACPEGQTCYPGEQCNYGRPPDNVSVSRTGPDSIRLDLKAGSSICGSQNSFRILLNGNDVSNQGLIAESGLDITITPSEGLGRQDGDFVILRGRGVTANETTPPHIQVIITDKSTTWIHRDLYL